MNENLMVQNLVKKLPEVYQPIFGHPEFVSERAFHTSRIDQCLQIASKLSNAYERPLRILDLGCAQGFLSLRLATEGHVVTGIEYLRENYELCVFLKEENNLDNLTFFHGDLMDIEDIVDVAKFDLVVAYSILHHPIHRDGKPPVKALMRRVAAQVPNAIIESAIAEEPVFWAEALPSSPRAMFSSYSFIRKIGQADTHLSEVRRPIHFCSNDFVLINGEIERLALQGDETHHGEDGNQSRLKRHFRTESSVVKVVTQFDELDDSERTTIDTFRQDLKNELNNLRNLPASITRSIEIIEFSEDGDESILVRTNLVGETVEKLMLDSSLPDRYTVCSDVLVHLNTLEQLGLTHCDLRTWNVLWDERTRTTSLIDLGAVKPEKSDEMWPFNPYYSFLFFVLTVFLNEREERGVKVPRSFPGRFSAIPNNVLQFVIRVLCLTTADLNFRTMESIWTELVTDDGQVEVKVPFFVTLLTEHARKIEEIASVQTDLRNYVEGLLDERSRTFEYVEDLVKELAKVTSYMNLVEPDRESLSSPVDSLLKRSRYLELEVNRLRQDLGVSESERIQYSKQLEMVRRSLSWRVTRPFRGLVYLTRRFIR